MKKTILLILLFAFWGYSCKQDSKLIVPDESYLEYLSNTKEVEKARMLFDTHCRLIAQFSPAEIREIQSKIHLKGYAGLELPESVVKDCLSDQQNAQQYVEAQKALSEYQLALKQIARKYPEFSQLTPRQKAEIIVKRNSSLSSQILSDQQLKNK